jgi:hypothetical protein
MVQLICVTCGKQFHISPSVAKVGQNNCSRKCRIKYFKKKLVGPCLKCGSKTTYITPKGKHLWFPKEGGNWCKSCYGKSMKKGHCVLCDRLESKQWYRVKKGRICNPCYDKQLVSGKCDNCGATQSKNWFTKYGKTRCDSCYAKVKKLGHCDFCGTKSSQSWFNDYEKKSCRKCHGVKYTTQLKIDAFKHYAINGKIECSWKGCHISDIDMLTIDHIDNKGAQHRKQLRGDRRGSGPIYRELKKENYKNKNYQILCWNHNLKKEIIRVRGKTDSNIFNAVLSEP